MVRASTPWSGEDDAKRVAKPIELTDDERIVLTKWSRCRSTSARLVLRAKIALLAAEGMQNKEIAARLSTRLATVGEWRTRFLEGRVAGTEKDAPRSGRKRSITSATFQEILRKTTQETPSTATHWSTRTMAEDVGVSRSSVL